jgi:hypothetical protein
LRMDSFGLALASISLIMSKIHKADKILKSYKSAESRFRLFRFLA